jgi:hypothetical protein
MPALQAMYSAHDRRVHTRVRITTAELRAWLTDAGFKSARVTYWNGLLLPAMFLHRKLTAQKIDAPSDVSMFPPWLEAAFFAATECERRLNLRMPCGSSAIGIAIA